MGHIIAEVTYSPIGTASTSLSKYITAALAVLYAQSEVRFELNPMGTVLEGERADVLALVDKMGEAIFGAGAQRVGTTLKIDDRRDKESSMQHKKQVVLDGLNVGDGETRGKE